MSKMRNGFLFFPLWMIWNLFCFHLTHAPYTPMSSSRDRARRLVILDRLKVEMLLLHTQKNQLEWFRYLTKMPPGHNKGSCNNKTNIKHPASSVWGKRELYFSITHCLCHSQQQYKYHLPLEHQRPCLQESR